MTPTELQNLLRDFYLDRLALLHAARGRGTVCQRLRRQQRVPVHDRREETHVSWLQHALLDLGAAIPPDPSAPDVKPTRKGNEAILELSANDATGTSGSSRNGATASNTVTNARHKGMLE